MIKIPAMNFYVLLTVQVLCRLGAAEAIREVEATLEEPVILSCEAKMDQNITYRRVSWYKVADNRTDMTGMIRKCLLNNEVQKYKEYNQSIEFYNDSISVKMMNVTCQDSGTYLCSLSAPVGKQNREGAIKLIVKGCSNSKENIVIVIETALLSLIVLLSLILLFLNYKCIQNMFAEKKQFQKVPSAPQCVEKEMKIFKYSKMPVPV
ncbi:uncharacterized protein CD83 [Latimeria chalumnae]|uniref:CD83 molecule n=1 Tax=Latimeria chalumnae TaxID=7897 RepID=H3A9C2_LATCH|nr:PREDICTED: uncharacterized protein LOC102362196 [Latimeria chalumnae]|eukprot:XP_006011899.1 PREDICTED: uncharacterized protein LOC102362196 [Latimeria chalumnae]